MFVSVGKSAFEMSAALFRHIGLFLNFAFCIVHGEAYRLRDNLGFLGNKSVRVQFISRALQARKAEMGLGITNLHENVSNIDNYLLFYNVGIK